jgi:hypothetical protein
VAADTAAERDRLPAGTASRGSGRGPRRLILQQAPRVQAVEVRMDRLESRMDKVEIRATQALIERRFQLKAVEDAVKLVAEAHADIIDYIATHTMPVELVVREHSAVVRQHNLTMGSDHA